MTSVEQNANKVAGSMEEGDNNMVEVIGFKEKKPKNPTEKERLQSSTEQPPEATMVMDWFNKIGNSLIVQMKKFRDEMKALKDAEGQARGENDDDVPIDKGEGKRKGGRGRKSNNKIVGKMSFSFELPLICFRNNFDIEKDLGSGSMESRKRGNRVEGSSQPESMEIQNEPESIDIENEPESKGMENEIVNDPWME
ncbi:hypothetical protein SESBI_08395 [Sesbania bispinosa]|nr:hypothetical protein SESBI_08395 [Sesbania bispinosa]